MGPKHKIRSGLLAAALACPAALSQPALASPGQPSTWAPIPAVTASDTAPHLWRAEDLPRFSARDAGKYVSDKQRHIDAQLSRALDKAPGKVPAGAQALLGDLGEDGCATPQRGATATICVTQKTPTGSVAEKFAPPQATTYGFDPGVWPPSPPEIASWCIGDIPLNSGYSYNRREACQAEIWVLEIRNLRTREVTGTLQIADLSYMFMNKSGHWTYRFWMSSNKPTGVLLLAPGLLSVYPYLKCSASPRNDRCTVRHKNPSQLITPLIPGVPLKFEATLDPAFSHKHKFVNHRAQLKVGFYPTNPATPIIGGQIAIPDARNGVTPTVRCDNQKLGYAKEGCILPAAPGAFVMSVSDTRSNEAAWHIFNSQNVLADHWGRYPDGKILSRTLSATDRRRNSRVACPKRLKRPKGKECDEFPFASTYQGAWFTRNSKGPRRYHRKMILRGDNRSAGAQLVAFYKRERMASRDKFWVFITQ